MYLCLCIYHEQKITPFIITRGHYYNIEGFYKDTIHYGGGIYYKFKELANEEFTWQDGTYCGIIEE